MSQLIWAPELHEIDGKWYIYFAATHTHDLDALGMFQHRMFVLECADSDPLTDRWQEKGQVVTPFDTFALDATTFTHQGKRWYLWAQKSPHIEGNSNLYLAEMANPWTLKGEPVMLSKPEFDWECRGFKVNEGPAVLMHGDKLFISYSASATDENYCMGLLWIDLAGRSAAARQTGIKLRSRCSAPAMKTASMAQVIIVLPKRRKGKMCWCITRGITPR